MSPIAAALFTPRRSQPRWSDLASAGVLVVWVLVGGVALCGATLALGSSLQRESWFSDGLRWLTLAIWALLLPVPGLAWRTVQAQCGVWRGRVAPREPIIWTLSAYRQTLAWTLTIAVAPLWLVALMAPTPAGWPGAALLIASLVLVTMAAGTLASAAWNGHIHGLWALPSATLLVAAPFAVFPAGAWHAWTSKPVLQACAAMAAVLAAVLAWHQTRPWLDAEGQHAITPPARESPRLWLRRWTKRLSEQARYVDAGGGVGPLIGLFTQLPVQLRERQAEGLIFLPWGSEVTMMAGYRSALFCALALAMMTGPSLHWRHLLAPSGLLRGRLGLRVALATLLRVGAVLALLYLAVGVSLLLAAPDRAAWLMRLPDLASRYLPLLGLDLCLATALATALRGLGGSFWRAALLIVALTLGWGLVHFTAFLLTGEPRPVLGTRGGAYVILGIAATFAALWLARWSWARVDLTSMMPRRRASEFDGD